MEAAYSVVAFVSLVVLAVSIIALIKPLPKLWLPTRRHAVLVFFVYFIALGIAQESGLLPLPSKSERKDPSPPKVSSTEIERAEVRAQSLLGREWMAQATSAEVQALLARGADVNARDENGNTPLHQAMRNQDPAVAALLLDHGADVNTRDQKGQTPLHEAADAATDGAPAILALLLDRGANATFRDNIGKLPIDYANENAFFEGTDVYWRLNDAGF